MFTVKIENSIGVIAMQHGKVNAMDVEFLIGLTEQLRDMENSVHVGAVVLTGTGSVFSAGVDLKRLVAEPIEYLDRFLPALRKLFFDVFAFRKPLVGAINGHALAGGCVVANGCDYRIVNEQSKIGMPELRVGLPLPPEGIEILRFVSARQHFQRIVTSGKTFVGQAAVEAGLADESLSPELVLPRAMQLAEEFLAVPPFVFELSKRQIRQPIIDRIRENESRFMPDINRIWRDDSVRRSVSEYVRRRL